jgi:hypothetical protein
MPTHMASTLGKKKVKTLLQSIKPENKKAIDQLAQVNTQE